MKEFQGENYLLDSETAVKLNNEHSSKMPIFDFHCHLSPKEIYEDRHFKTITEAWLGGDHYKWRLLREAGYPEEYITGDKPDYERFLAFAKTMPSLIGNPIYEWTHLELKKYFGINETLSEKTAPEIYGKANKILETLSARKMIELCNVEIIFTTDDPIDDLHWHALIAEDKSFKTKVVPCFRPDKCINIERDEFPSYIEKLSEVSGIRIDSFPALQEALENRLVYFVERGATASDQALDTFNYCKATDEEANEVLLKRLGGEHLSEHELDVYKGRVLITMAKLYKKYDIVQQYHIGALRNNNDIAFETLGPDTGYDACHDQNVAAKLSGLLNEENSLNALPKTVIYALNSKDYTSIVTLMNCFQFGKGSIQLGAAWWFNDHYDGIYDQLKALSAGGMLSEFIGMLTDSRSFLSYPRHDYFRRILCNYIGNLVESGRYPDDEETLGQIVENISYYNAKRYFRQ